DISYLLILGNYDHGTISYLTQVDVLNFNMGLCCSQNQNGVHHIDSGTNATTYSTQVTVTHDSSILDDSSTPGSTHNQNRTNTSSGHRTKRKKIKINVTVEHHSNRFTVHSDGPIDSIDIEHIEKQYNARLVGQRHYREQSPHNQVQSQNNRAQSLHNQIQLPYQPQSQI
ncbi:unnamed protein product, partial [Owenia fusiformis]